MTTATLPKTPRAAGTPTRRGLEILCHVVNHGGQPEAAKHLYISINTIKIQLNRAYRELGVIARPGPGNALVSATLKALAGGHIKLYPDGTIAPATNPPKAGP
jgi:DNA-binding NarL/FixJ family response regulator